MTPGFVKRNVGKLLLKARIIFCDGNIREARLLARAGSPDGQDACPVEGDQSRQRIIKIWSGPSLGAVPPPVVGGFPAAAVGECGDRSPRQPATRREPTSCRSPFLLSDFQYFSFLFAWELSAKVLVSLLFRERPDRCFQFIQTGVKGIILFFKLVHFVRLRPQLLNFRILRREF